MCLDQLHCMFQESCFNIYYIHFATIFEIIGNCWQFVLFFSLYGGFRLKGRSECAPVVIFYKCNTVICIFLNVFDGQQKKVVSKSFKEGNHHFIFGCANAMCNDQNKALCLFVENIVYEFLF